MRNERGLLTGDPAMARKPGRDVVDLALYEDDPEYRAMIEAKYPVVREHTCRFEYCEAPTGECPNPE